MSDRYAVIGNPVEHSKSPLIHAAFARQTGQDIEYASILAPLDGFKQTVTDFFRRGGRGANVTVPFKFAAYDLAAANASERAHDAGAANILMFEGGKIICDNTDGVGLVTDIQNNLGIAIQNKRILLIGAGGAAGGVLHPIFEQQPALLPNQQAEHDALDAQREHPDRDNHWHRGRELKRGADRAEGAEPRLRRRARPDHPAGKGREHRIARHHRPVDGLGVNLPEAIAPGCTP